MLQVEKIKFGRGATSPRVLKIKLNQIHEIKIQNFAEIFIIVYSDKKAFLEYYIVNS